MSVIRLIRFPSKTLKRNVVDHATTDMAEAVDGADYIFLCVPVGNLEEYFQTTDGAEAEARLYRHGCWKHESFDH